MNQYPDSLISEMNRRLEVYKQDCNITDDDFVLINGKLCFFADGHQIEVPKYLYNIESFFDYLKKEVV